MVYAWIRKKAVKGRRHKGKRLVIDGERPSVVTLVAVSGLLVAVGVFVLQRTLAAPQTQPASPGVTLEPSPVATAVTSPSPTPTPTLGP